MSELAEALLAFRALEREMQERGRHLDLLYEGIMLNVVPDNEPGVIYIDVDEINDDPPVLPDIADEVPDIVEIFSLSSWASDSGFGGSNSNLSSISEFSSATAELRHNEACHFGYLVAQEHVAPDVQRESESHTHSLPAADMVDQMNAYQHILNEIDDCDYMLGRHANVETDILPARKCSSETSITRRRKRKRDGHNSLMKSSSDNCIDICQKKRRLIN